jgi:hypothetical protein
VSSIEWLREYAPRLPHHRLLCIDRIETYTVGVAIEPFSGELVERYGITDRGGYCCVLLPDDRRELLAWVARVRKNWPNLAIAY